MARQRVGADRSRTGIEPIISVVIPTFARPAKLRACLDGLAQQTSHHDDFEVVVVDDGSPTPVVDLVEAFDDRMAVGVVGRPHAGPGAARNAGAAVARGRYLAFIDDDCVPAPNWLSVLVRELGRDPDQLVGGRVENSLKTNPYAEASDRISRFVYEYYQRDGARERFFQTNNVALATDRFLALAGFTTSIPSATAEDKEFCDRGRASGLKLTHVPDAVVYHAHDLTFRGFVRQHFNYGRGIFVFRLMRRARSQGPLVPEPLPFYSGLVLAPLRSGEGQRPLLVPLIYLSQLATIAGAAYEALRSSLNRRAEDHRRSNA